MSAAARVAGRPEMGTITSVGICELGPAQEAQVARPGPDRLRVSKAQSGVKVIRLQDLLAIAAVVTAAIVSAVDPDLKEETALNEGRGAAQDTGFRFLDVLAF